MNSINDSPHALSAPCTQRACRSGACVCAHSGNAVTNRATMHRKTPARTRSAYLTNRSRNRTYTASSTFRCQSLSA
eukprot:5195258-Pleurochrysis_carterae.AAC.1